MQVPINRHTSDPFYRYKMPSLLVRHEGKHKNIKTILANLSAISQSLKRQDILLQQFITCRLSVNTLTKDSHFVIKGEYKCDEVQDIIYEFIELLVLCKACGNPETVINVDEQVVLHCYACGQKSVIDGNSRIINYIKKNTAVAAYCCYENGDDDGSRLVDDVRDNLGNLYEYYHTVPEKKRNDVIKASFACTSADYAFDVYEQLFKEDKHALRTFFECLEQFIVKEDKFRDIKEIFSNLKYLQRDDYEYFRKKSAVVDKRDSTRIRDVLMNCVDYK